MSDERIVRKSPEEIKRDLSEGKDRTDWERLRQMTEEEIERAAREDPDTVLLDEEWFRMAQLVVPSGEKEQISIRLDEDILAYFREGGTGYQTRINDVLKAYVLSRRFKEQEDVLEG